MSRKIHIIPSLTMSLVLMTCVITKANDNSNNTNILINENATATRYIFYRMYFNAYDNFQ